MRRTIVVLCAVAVAAAASAVPSQATESTQRVIVRLRPGAPLAAATADVVADGGHIRHTYTRVFNGYSAELTASDALALRGDPRVLSVTPDLPIHALTLQPGPPSWGLDRIDQRQGPLSASYDYGSTGSGVTVYVVDTGVRATHVDLAGRVADGKDFVDGDSDPDDCNGHGTHVAGTIAGSIYGVAKDATIVPVRVLDCFGDGVLSSTLDAFDWVIGDSQLANPRKPAVVNFSAGLSGVDADLDAAVAKVVTSGISFVAAAGNDGVDACLRSPARVNSVLTVGATDETDLVTLFSNSGDCVDLFAPGLRITSDGIATNTATAVMSGTSMAAPHVAGVAARYLQGHPDATPGQVADHINGLATPDAALQTDSVNDRLLFMDDAATPQPLPAPQAATGGITPSTLTFTDSSPRPITATLRVSKPVELGSLTAYVRSPDGDTSCPLLFGNPSLDKLTWTAASSCVKATFPKGVWTLTTIRGLTLGTGGASETTSFATPSPITMTVNGGPPVFPPPVVPPVVPPPVVTPPIVTTPVVTPPVVTPVPARTATALAIGVTDGRGHSLRRLEKGRAAYVAAVLRRGTRGANAARVVLQAHRTGRNWSTVATRTTATVNGVRGTALLRVRPTATTYYRWVYRGSTVLRPSQSSIRRVSVS